MAKRQCQNETQSPPCRHLSLFFLCCNCCFWLVWFTQKRKARPDPYSNKLLPPLFSCFLELYLVLPWKISKPTRGLIGSGFLPKRFLEIAKLNSEKMNVMSFPCSLFDVHEVRWANVVNRWRFWFMSIFSFMCLKAVSASSFCQYF